jgi:hypothetical protein
MKRNGWTAEWKVGAMVAYHARKWYVHVASAFPLARHYRIIFA